MNSIFKQSPPSMKPINETNQADGRNSKRLFSSFWLRSHWIYAQKTIEGTIVSMNLYEKLSERIEVRTNKEVMSPLGCLRDSSKTPSKVTISFAQNVLAMKIMNQKKCLYRKNRTEPAWEWPEYLGRVQSYLNEIPSFQEYRQENCKLAELLWRSFHNQTNIDWCWMSLLISSILLH